MVINLKKLDPNAVVPTYSKVGDAGLDLTAVSRKYNEDKLFWEYGTGLAVQIPEGFVGLIFPRSSLSNKDMLLCNHVGVIDSNYRGEITFRFKELDNINGIYEVGDRIGQLVVIPYPVIGFKEVNELTSTERGTGSYGSTGR